MKRATRVLGFDDGPFTFQDETTPLVGVMVRAPSYVEAVVVGEVTVDGRDATDMVIELLEGRGLLETVALVLFDGGTVAGFNVLDLERLHRVLQVPTAALLRDRPDGSAVGRALEEHLDEPEVRRALLEAQPLEALELGGATSYVRRVGIDLGPLQELLRAQRVQGRTPEPLRVAHLVATALVEGASRGR